MVSLSNFFSCEMSQAVISLYGKHRQMSVTTTNDQLKKQSAAVAWNIPVFGVAINVEDNSQ